MLQSPGSVDRSLSLAHANAALWGLGNGLTSTTLVTYLARELGAAGLAVGLIAASPNLAGVLRLAAPWLLRRMESRKTFAVAMFWLSGVLLLALPIVCWPGRLASGSLALVVLVSLWGLWHLAMFLGVIALWSWLGDLAPSETRGRFIGVRQSWLMAGQIAGMVSAGVAAWWLREALPDASRWPSLAWPALAGAVLMLVAVVPLVGMRNVPFVPRQVEGMAGIVRAVRDRPFRYLLLFWCWAGVANGVSQAAQGLFPIVVLQLPVLAMLGLQAMMHVGQIAVSPAVGRWVDRRGCRAVMIGSQVLVSLALGFYALASPDHPYWIAGAWTLWIAYAGLNVCLPHLLLRLTPGENSPSYIATYFALGGLATGLSAVVFGGLFDALPRDLAAALIGLELSRFQVFFGVGMVLRLSAVVWLVFLPDGRDTSRYE